MAKLSKLAHLSGHNECKIFLECLLLREIFRSFKVNILGMCQKVFKRVVLLTLSNIFMNYNHTIHAITVCTGVIYVCNMEV